MSITWGAVETAAATAVLVTLAIEYAAKPQLEARKERHLEALRTRRRFEAMLVDLALSTQMYLIDDSSADRDSRVRANLQEERRRQYERTQALGRELFDDLGRFTAAYPDFAGLHSDLILFGTTVYGVLMSARSRHRQAEIIAELVTLASRRFAQHSVFKAADIMTAREQLRARTAQLEEP